MKVNIRTLNPNSEVNATYYIGADFIEATVNDVTDRYDFSNLADGEVLFQWDIARTTEVAVVEKVEKSGVKLTVDIVNWAPMKPTKRIGYGYESYITSEYDYAVERWEECFKPETRDSGQGLIITNNLEVAL